jgi:hypothetical protein
MPEPAVVIAVSGHRVPYRPGGAAVEQPLEPAPVDHPGVRGDEGGGGVEVWSVHRSIRSPEPVPRIERNGHGRDILKRWRY